MKQKDWKQPIVLKGMLALLIVALLAGLVSVPARADETTTVSPESTTEAPESSASLDEGTTSSSDETSSENVATEPVSESGSESETSTEPESSSEPESESEPDPGPELPVTVLYGTFPFEEITEDLPVVIVTGLVVNVRESAGTVPIMPMKRHWFSRIPREKNSK